MNTKKLRVLLLALIVTMTMMAGSMSVFAVQGDSSELSDEAPTVTKKVTIAEGVTMPATDFVFTATKVSNYDEVVTPSAAPASFTTTISGTQTVGDGQVKTFEGQLVIPEIITATTGEYTYELTETAPDQTTGSGWTTVDKTKYYLHVYVKNDKTVLYSITDTNTENAKKVEAVFENEYEKKSDLTISKTVKNPEYVDESKGEFSFTLTFTTNGSATAPESATGTKTAADGTESPITVTNGGEFKLKDGEKVEFSDLPVGVKYTLVETKPSDPNYQKTEIVAKNGTTETKVTETTQNPTLENQLIGEDTNTAEVTNTYNEVTLTGVIMTVLPYFMMIAVACAAAAMYIASRRRRAAR